MKLLLIPIVLAVSTSALASGFGLAYHKTGLNDVPVTNEANEGKLYMMAIEGEHKASIFKGHLQLPEEGVEFRCGPTDDCPYNYGLGALSWDDVQSDEYDRAFSSVPILEKTIGQGIDAAKGVLTCSTITTGAWRNESSDIASRYTLCSSELGKSKGLRSDVASEELGKEVSYVGAHTVSIGKNNQALTIESNFRPGIFYRVGKQVLQDLHADASDADNVEPLSLAIFEVSEVAK